VLIVYANYSGDTEAAKRELETITKLVESPVPPGVKEITYKEFQSLLEPMGPPQYLHDRAVLLGNLSDEYFDVAWNNMQSAPPEIHPSMVMFLVGAGAMGKVEKTATPFYNRNTMWWALVAGSFEPAPQDFGRDPEHPENRALISAKWTANMIGLLGKKCGISSYAPVAGDEPGVDIANLSRVYGQNVPRLLEIKKKYDPENIFKLNRNLVMNEARAIDNTKF